MDLSKAIEKMKKGKLEAFKEAEDFLGRDLESSLSHLKNCSITECVNYFCRFYAEKQMCKNLKLACQNLHDGNQTKANAYLESAGVYLQNLTNQSP